VLKPHCNPKKKRGGKGGHQKEVLKRKKKAPPAMIMDKTCPAKKKGKRE